MKRSKAKTFAAWVSGLAAGLGVRWLEITFACVWTVGAFLLLQRVWFTPQFHNLFTWGYRLPWPASFIYYILFMILVDFVLVAMALGVYLALRTYTVRTLGRHLLVVFLVLLVGNVVWALLPIIPPLFFGAYVLWRLPLFFGLLVALSAAEPTARNIPATECG